MESEKILMHGLYDFEMVDSGIDWIGLMPSHWRLVPFSTLDNDPKYLDRLLNSRRFIEKFGRRSLDDESLKEITIARPPLFEQTEIVGYLEAQA